MPTLLRNPIYLALIAIALLLLLGSTISIVPETRQAVIVRFGEPVRIVNRYQANEQFGSTGAGIIARLPFAEQIVWIDKRVLSVEMERQQVLSTDQLSFKSMPSPVIVSSIRCACISRQAARTACPKRFVRSWVQPCATSWASGPLRHCSARNGDK